MKTIKKFGILLLTLLIFACNTDDIVCLFSPIVGTNGSLTICNGDTVTEDELFNSIEGFTTSGGVWTPALAGAGTYTYTIDAFEGCPAASVEVVVTEEDPSLVGTWLTIDPFEDGSGNLTIVFNSDLTGSAQEGEDTPEAFTYVTTDTVVTILIAGEPGTEDETLVLLYEFETCDEVNIYVPGEPGTEDVLYVFARQ